MGIPTNLPTDGIPIPDPSAEIECSYLRDGTRVPPLPDPPDEPADAQEETTL